MNCFSYCSLLGALQCSENCGGGIKIRDIQCMDTRDKRPLRPFHCQLLGAKPTTNLHCNPKPCSEWNISPWSKVTESVPQFRPSYGKGVLNLLKLMSFVLHALFSSVQKHVALEYKNGQFTVWNSSSAILK